MLKVILTSRTYKPQDLRGLINRNLFYIQIKSNCSWTAAQDWRLDEKLCSLQPLENSGGWRKFPLHHMAFSVGLGIIIETLGDRGDVGRGMEDFLEGFNGSDLEVIPLVASIVCWSELQSYGHRQGSLGNAV